MHSFVFHFIPFFPICSSFFICFRCFLFFSFFFALTLPPIYFSLFYFVDDIDIITTVRFVIIIAVCSFQLSSSFYCWSPGEMFGSASSANFPFNFNIFIYFVQWDGSVLVIHFRACVYYYNRYIVSSMLDVDKCIHFIINEATEKKTSTKKTIFLCCL